MSRKLRTQSAWYLFLIITIFCLAPAIPALAATSQCINPELIDRPRIGLALGGGGARGYAHIGVLKRMEELRVPYHYIAGTSMGSIVGGFLATGMDTEELTQVVRDANWGDLFDDKTDREDVPFRRKTDDNLGLFGPKLGVGKDSALLPAGFVAGQKITFMFESISSQRVNMSNFDHLPIPYRAIATDIVTGSMVVIDKGEVSMAMRASMAVPGVFDPVRYEDALLVDGGLVRNLPVDVARDMGADAVIAIDVGTKLAKKEDLNNALSIISQMTGLLTVGNTEVQIETLGDDDILVTPEIGDLVSSADFAKLDEAIQLGYDAAISVQDQLEKYSLSEAEYRVWRQRIGDCVEGPPQVHFVRLNNQSRFSDDVILELINIEPGKPLDLEQLDYDIRQIYGLGFIRHARFSVVENEGQQGIEITVEQDERGTDFIETGLDIAFGTRGTTFNLRGAYLKTDLDERGSEIRAMLQIGESAGIFVDYFRPLDDRLRYSFHPSAFYLKRPLYIFNDDGDALGEVELNEYGGSLSLTREFSRYARATAGYTRFAGDLDVTVGNPNFQPFPFDGGELHLELEYDRLDDRYLPTRGLYSKLKYIESMESLGADVDFSQLEFSVFGSHTFGRHNLVWGGQYNASLDDHAPIYSWYSGGGFLNMSGYEPNSLTGPNYAMVLAGYRWEAVQSGLLPGYVGTTLEYGNVSVDRDDVLSDGFINGSFYFAYKTPLGPVYLGLGWSENRNTIYFLRFGSVFGARSFGRR